MVTLLGYSANYSQQLPKTLEIPFFLSVFILILVAYRLMCGNYEGGFLSGRERITKSSLREGQRGSRRFPSLRSTLMNQQLCYRIALTHEHTLL